jgi:serine/threonine protein kinase
VGLVHRDIKLENVLVKSLHGRLQVVLTDFGFAIEEKEMIENFERVGSMYEMVTGNRSYT